MNTTHSRVSCRIRAELAAWQASRGNEAALRELVATDPGDVDALIRICSDPRRPPEIRRITAVVLGRLRARKAVGVLIKNLWEDQRDLAISSGAALADIRSRTATLPLVRVLRESPFPASREAAAMVFKRIRDEKAISALRATLLDARESPWIRFQAGAALAGWKPSRTIRAFLRTVSDQSAEVRHVSAYALGLSGDDRALSVLKRMSTDNEVALPGSTVGEQALESLDTFARRRKKTPRKPRESWENRG